MLVVDRFVHRIPPIADNPHATHLPILIAIARLRRVRKVLEFGAGLYSTLTFLDPKAFPDLTELHSYENDEAWETKIRKMVGRDTRLRLQAVQGPMAVVPGKVWLDGYDLIFIDDSKTVDERVRTIEEVVRQHPETAIVVIHDYEVKAYRTASRHFQQRFRFTALNPNVGVLWNGGSVNHASLHRLNELVRSRRDEVRVDDRGGWHLLVASKIKRVDD